MAQSMASVVIISPMVWLSIPHMGTWDPLGIRVSWTVLIMGLRLKVLHGDMGYAGFSILGAEANNGEVHGNNVEQEMELGSNEGLPENMECRA